MGMLAALLEHPEEIPALLRVRYAAYQATKLPKDPNLAFCYDMLNRVSRSFAVVIQQLGPELRDAVCIFYLVLRGLDTVEDDMAIPVETKLPILHSFHKHIYDPSWHFICGTKDYKRLMTQFEHVSHALLALDKRYQAVIEDITKRMGAGMAKYITKEVETVAEYDEYCHFVAGLVGIGLSDLFAAAQLEEPVAQGMSNSMGLFLQKTNIIRDYLEDIVEEPAPRMFWPKEIWGKYAPQLENFKDMEGEAAPAVQCLNELITDALRHASESLTYLARLKDNRVFRFCAIPQIMAMGTLAECFNNVRVFRGVVKMRRGLTARYMEGTRSMADAYAAFDQFAEMLGNKIDPADPNATQTAERVETIRRRCRAASLAAKSNESTSVSGMSSGSIFLLVVWLIFAVLAALAFGLPHLRSELHLSESAQTTQALARQDLAQQVLAIVLLTVVTVWLLISQSRQN